MSAEKVVKIYSTSVWPWCKKTKSFLDEKNVSYTDLDVAEDKEARNEMIKISGQMGVPVISIDDQVLVGYNESKLKQALGI